jgi:hypothetical protein
MAELQSNGNYENYLAQMFNPLAGGAGQFNPYGNIQYNPYGTQLNPFEGIGTGFGGVRGIAAQPQNPWQQNPWVSQSFSQGNGLWQGNAPWQQLQQQQQNPVHSSFAAIQFAHHLLTKQAAQAIQCAQALQSVLQFVQNVAAQQAMSAQSTQGNAFSGIGQGFGQGVLAQGFAPYNLLGSQNNPTLQQVAQHMAMQQASPFRYGLAA